MQRINLLEPTAGGEPTDSLRVLKGEHSASFLHEGAGSLWKVVIGVHVLAFGNLWPCERLENLPAGVGMPH